VQPALQDEPRHSRGVAGPSLAGNQPKTGKNEFRIANEPLSVRERYSKTPGLRSFKVAPFRDRDEKVQLSKRVASCQRAGPAGCGCTMSAARHTCACGSSVSPLAHIYVGSLWVAVKFYNVLRVGIGHFGGLGGPGGQGDPCKRWGGSPPPSGMVSRALGAAQTSKRTDFRSLNKLKLPPKGQPRIRGF
jgi:hypothetical protein